jgi:hypothetical protein
MMKVEKCIIGSNPDSCIDDTYVHTCRLICIVEPNNVFLSWFSSKKEGKENRNDYKKRKEK